MICLFIIILHICAVLEGIIKEAGVLHEGYTAPWKKRTRNEKSMKKRKKCIVLLNTLLRASGHENIVYYSYTKCANFDHHAQDLSIRRFKSGTWGSKMTQKKALKISPSGSNLAPQVQIWHLRFKFGTTGEPPEA